MSIGIVILCRFDSKRFPGKILHNIKGRPIIAHIVERIRLGAPNRSIVVATSRESSDDQIAAYCKRAGLTCFRGSLEDVAGRFLQCMESNGWDFGVRINGDNLFLDPQTLNAMLAIADTDQFDFVTNVPGRSFPYGMSVEIVRKSFYHDAMLQDFDVGHREHVTSGLYEKPDLGRRYIFKNRVCPEAAGLQLAIDTPDDMIRARKIIDLGGPNPALLTLNQIHDFVTRVSKPSPWRGAIGPLLIAEIGGNHEGNFEVAMDMCKQAIDSGADCIKFQLYKGDTLVSKVESPERHKHFQKFELTREEHIQLAKFCHQAGVGYNSSVWDMEMLEWIDPYLDFYKIGSGDLTAWPLLSEFARRGKPILLSTGLASMEEVLHTVSYIQRVDKRYKHPEMLCIMQCTSMYPIPDSDANLRVMDAFRAYTGLSVGYSDHTIGSNALMAAVAMGAEVLEFHFTDSREGKSFRDHQVSLTADEVRLLRLELIRIIEFRGESIKELQSSELANRHDVSFRRAAYLSRDFIPGEIIGVEDIVFLRPCHGVDARDFDALIGATVSHPLKAYQAIDLDAVILK